MTHMLCPVPNALDVTLSTWVQHFLIWFVFIGSPTEIRYKKPTSFKFQGVASYMTKTSANKHKQK